MKNGIPICGLNKTTLLDYPGEVASTIFLGGCNFRCPFCHNGELVLTPNDYISYSEKEIFSHLAKRKGLINGVCITGGEPTIHASLYDFISRIKELGYLVKLDTNGSNPRLLERLLKNDLIDYAAMDIKADPDNYGRTIGKSPAESAPIFPAIEESVRILRSSRILYEFRTTAVKGIHDISSFLAIGEWLDGSPLYFIQNYVESSHVISPVFSSFSKTELEAFASVCIPHFTSVSLRGVE